MAGDGGSPAAQARWICSATTPATSAPIGAMPISIIEFLGSTSRRHRFCSTDHGPCVSSDLTFQLA